MLKKTLTLALLTVAAGLANAGETNPLHPAYAHFTARANVQTASGNVEIAKNPLTPSYYQWNVAPSAGSNTIDLANNNPLHPGYKRS
jgi:hypothetical protein